MSPQSDCRGVVLDRNFDVAWNDSHDQSSCSQSYPGPNPFSEIETKAISNVLHYYGHKIVAYIHVHAGTYDTHTFKGDAVLYPRGYTDLPGDDDKYLDIKGEIEEAMRNASFRVMSVTVDNLYHWYGRVTGSSVDYAAHIFGIPFAMEFVMQLYESGFFAYDNNEFVDYIALTQIWERIIYVVFKYFAKSVGIVEENQEDE
ncbi:unnamed protein product [Arctia plantaginis]|uniref:Peptidase M14 domain-containing protein n=1 Tax=Arctia plantaginis TaxID=874455 RepID=A0A8S0Z8Z9_ARCPL|nr:unnamed protein product [Arctia plantaginis]